MNSGLFDVAQAIPKRIAELERIVNLAESNIKLNEEIYNTLCRASCVLLASHLEGFLKDLTTSLAADLNFHCKDFSAMPLVMKRTFCEKIAFYEGVEKTEIDQRINQLMSFFEKNSVNIDLQAFSYKENKNRNPGGDVIQGTLSKFGIPLVLHSISGGEFENIFKNDKAITYRIRRDMRRFRSRLYVFPCKELDVKYAFSGKPAKTKQGDTIWHTFIEEVMRRRHSIAHGDTMKNETDIHALKDDIEKMDVLMHAILYSSVSYTVKNL